MSDDPPRCDICGEPLDINWRYTHAYCEPPPTPIPDTFLSAWDDDEPDFNLS